MRYAERGYECGGWATAAEVPLAVVVQDACALLRPRQQYARAVIRGRQLWSGADLRGRAKRWGAGYARQRRAARDALWAAGGDIVPTYHGRLVTAVYVGADDYGDALYRTDEAVTVRPDRRWCVAAGYGA